MVGRRSAIAGISLSTHVRRAESSDYTGHLLGSPFYVVVHDHGVGDRAAQPLFPSADFKAATDVLLGVAPSPKPDFLVGGRRRHDHDEAGIGAALLYLLGSVELDLQDDVAVLGGVEDRRAVEVAGAGELGVLQESAVGDPGQELLARR